MGNIFKSIFFSEHSSDRSNSSDTDGEEITINGQVIKTNVMSEIKSIFNSNPTKELKIHFRTSEGEVLENSIDHSRTNGHIDEEMNSLKLDEVLSSQEISESQLDMETSIECSNGIMTTQYLDCVDDFPESRNFDSDSMKFSEALNEIDKNGHHTDLIEQDDPSAFFDISEPFNPMNIDGNSTDVDSDIIQNNDYVCGMSLANFNSPKSAIDFGNVNDSGNFNDFIESQRYRDIVTFQLAIDHHMKKKAEGKENEPLDALYFQDLLRHSMFMNQNQSQVGLEPLESSPLSETKVPEPSPKIFAKPTTAHMEQQNIAPKEIERKIEEKQPKPPVSNVDLPGTTTGQSKLPATMPCGHSCKHGEEVKSDLKKVCQGICDHHSKDSKKCDCTYCEVFGTGRTQSNPKDTLTRNRLRIRLLNQRKAKAKPPTQDVAAATQPAAEPSTPNPVSTQPSLASLQSDLTSKGISGKKKKGTNVPEELEKALHYIEGEDRGSILAEKKAAKKARQRQKKDDERLQKEEEERKKQEEEKLVERMRALQLAKESAEQEKNNKVSKKERKKNAKAQQPLVTTEKSNVAVFEETIPALVTIKRSHESDTLLTIKFQDRTQEELLASLVLQNNNQVQNNQLTTTVDSKKSKKNKGSQQVQQTVAAKQIVSQETSSSKKKKNKNVNEKPEASSVIANEVKITLAIPSQTLLGGSLGQRSNSIQIPSQSSTSNLAYGANTANHVDKLQNGNSKDSKKNKKNQNKSTELGSNKKAEKDANRNRESPACELSNLRLPPGITITKVNGPVSNRNFKTTDLQNAQQTTSNATSIPTAQPTSNSGASTESKKSKKNKKKKQALAAAISSQQANGQDIVTLKNPIFQSYNPKPETERVPDLNQCQASIFKNDNGMVTIRSSRLQQSLNSGTPIPNLLSDLKPVIGPDVGTSYGASSSSCNFTEPKKMTTFNAQQILSGLPGIEITKVDKCSARNDMENRKSSHTAEVSIIPAGNNVDKFNIEKEDWHYDSVFTPKDVLEDDMDADERELEAFKRFCSQSIPPKRKEKVAHLNVKDIVLKKKNDQNSV